MKKILPIISLIAFLVAGFVSCNKIKEIIFKSFVGDGGSINFTINPITNTNEQSDNQTLTVNLNIDSIIRKYTEGVFGINSVDKVSLESAELIINNPDAENNIQNLESFYLDINTNTSTNGLNIGSIEIPDQYAETIVLTSTQGVDLKPYLIGTQLSYLYRYKARKPTTKLLDCTLKFKFKFD